MDSLFHRLPQRGIPVCEIDLAPLAPDDMRTLVRAAASLGPDQLERVVTLAEGNPLLGLETARAIAAGPRCCCSRTSTPPIPPASN